MTTIMIYHNSPLVSVEYSCW